MKKETVRPRERRSFLTLCLLCAAAVLAILNLPTPGGASSDKPTAQHPASSLLRTFLR
jgi:hypothetical protein